VAKHTVKVEAVDTAIDEVEEVVTVNPVEEVEEVEEVAIDVPPMPSKYRAMRSTFQIPFLPVGVIKQKGKNDSYLAILANESGMVYQTDQFTNAMISDPDTAIKALPLIGTITGIDGVISYTLGSGSYGMGILVAMNSLVEKLEKSVREKHIIKLLPFFSDRVVDELIRANLINQGLTAVSVDGFVATRYKEFTDGNKIPATLNAIKSATDPNDFSGVTVDSTVI